MLIPILILITCPFNLLANQFVDTSFIFIQVNPTILEAQKAINDIPKTGIALVQETLDHLTNVLSNAVQISVADQQLIGNTRRMKTLRIRQSNYTIQDRNDILTANLAKLINQLVASRANSSTTAFTNSTQAILSSIPISSLIPSNSTTPATSSDVAMPNSPMQMAPFFSVETLTHLLSTALAAHLVPSTATSIIGLYALNQGLRNLLGTPFTKTVFFSLLAPDSQLIKFLIPGLPAGILKALQNSINFPDIPTNKSLLNFSNATITSFQNSTTVGLTALLGGRESIVGLLLGNRTPLEAVLDGLGLDKGASKFFGGLVHNATVILSGFLKPIQA